MGFNEIREKIFLIFGKVSCTRFLGVVGVVSHYGQRRERTSSGGENKEVTVSFPQLAKVIIPPTHSLKIREG